LYDMMVGGKYSRSDCSCLYDMMVGGNYSRFDCLYDMMVATSIYYLGFFCVFFL
jgi:hypothetical protein